MILSDKPYKIGILLLDDFALMSYASTVEPFRAANMLADREVFRLVNYSIDGKSARSSNNVIVPSTGRLPADTDERLDMLLVVAGGDSKKIMQAPVYAELRSLALRGTTLGGISGGPLLLAAARLMSGWRMTVHWEHRETLLQLSDDLLVEKSIYVVDRKRVTCAGGIAALDLSHALIAQKLGVEFARRVSDWFLHTEVRPSQSVQRSALTERYGTRNRLVLEAIELMENHMGDPLSNAEIASLLGITPRHINRLFRSELGVSPKAFNLDMRLQYARRLIKNTSLSITDLALLTGFSDSAHFSTRFKTHFGTPPSKIDIT